MPDLFKEIVPSILVSKKNVFENVDSYKDYLPYIVNRALSNYMDTVIFANEMNMLNEIPKNLQYEFLLNTVRSWKRPFGEWMKSEKFEDIEVITEYYNVSQRKAKDILRILSSDQIEEIKKQLDKGGRNDKNRRNAGGKTKESS